MAEKTPTQRLWQDALTGKISRRDVLIRGAALGISAPVLAALAQESIRGTLAAEEGKPTATFYDWELNLHPGIYDVGDAVGVTVEVAPTENFGNDRFIAEANDETSTWDMYGGVTPFLEMLQLVETGTIEPWDAYVTDEDKADLFPATLAEGTTDGSWYVWPLLLDICVQASNAGILEKAGIDPDSLPSHVGRVHCQCPEGAGERRCAVRPHLRQPRLAVVDPSHPLHQHRRVHAGRPLPLQQRCRRRSARNPEEHDAVDQRRHSGRGRSG